MERLNWRVGEMDQGGITLVLDVANAFGHVSLPVVWAWVRHFNFSRKIERVISSGVSPWIW